MLSTPWLLTALLAPLTAGGHPPVGIQARTQAQQVCCDLYPAATGELVIEIGAGDDRPSMESIARQYAALTGQHLVYSDETKQLLQNQGTGLQETVTVPAKEVQSFFEQLMSANDFLFLPSPLGKPRMLGIVSLKTGARNTVRGNAHFVPVDEIGHFAKHPATLITTTISLPNTDVRQLSNSMRTMVTDANTQQMLPAGNTNTLVLTGFGSSVAELVGMLERIDEASKVEAFVPQYEVIRLQFAQARHLVGTLGAIVGSGLGARTQPGSGDETVTPFVPPSRLPKIQMDERTNSLVIAAAPVEMALLKALIAQLDVEE